MMDWNGSTPANRQHCVYALPVGAPCASANLAQLDSGRARDVDGVLGVFFASDIPGINSIQTERGNDPLLAEGEVTYAGQPVCVVLGRSPEACRNGAEALNIEFHPLASILDLDHARAMQTYEKEPQVLSRGDIQEWLGPGEPVLTGSVSLETQLPFPSTAIVARCRRRPDGRVDLEVNGGIPSDIRSVVSRIMRIPESRVFVNYEPVASCADGGERVARMAAGLVALAATRTTDEVSLVVDREWDTLHRSKRRAVYAKYEVSCDEEGRLMAVNIDYLLEAGHILDESQPALDRLLLHSDGAYYIPNFCASARLCKTNYVAGSDLAAEGSAQGSFVIEEILSHVAQHLGLSPERVRAANFYREEEEYSKTPYGQRAPAGLISRIWRETLTLAELEVRREEIRNWNAEHPYFKRGIGMIPVKLGVGDPRTERNQATAGLQMLPDGSVRAWAGLIDNGEPWRVRIAETVCRNLGLEPDRVWVTAPHSDSGIRNAASLGVDPVHLASQAVREACRQIKQRLRTVAGQMLAASGQSSFEVEDIRFGDGWVYVGPNPSSGFRLEEVSAEARRRRVDLGATGHFRTPNLLWNPAAGEGSPFEDFAVGAAVCEVELDAFSGECRLLRTEIVHDAGDSSSPACDRGVIARGFAFGYGWLFSESLGWTADGTLTQDALDSYALPGYSDTPLAYRIALLRTSGVSPDGGEGGRAARSLRESPVVLSLAAREAVKDALRSFGAPPGLVVNLSFPCSPSAVMNALRDLAQRVVSHGRPRAS